MSERDRRARWVSILALVVVLLAVPVGSAAMSQTVVLAAKYLDWSPDTSQLAFGGRPTDPLDSPVMIVDSAAIMTPPTLMPVPTPADS